MKTTEKRFDAVKESRRWKEETSRKLDAMDLPTRLAFLESLRRPVPAGSRPAAGPDIAPGVVREDPPDWNTENKA